MSISSLNIQRVLLDLGYESISNKTSVIFSNVIDQVFFGFGSTIQNGLITEAKKQMLPKNFKFPYYSLVEKSVLDFLGPRAGEKILSEINVELSRQTKIEGTSEEILNELSRKEVHNKIRHLAGHEHIIYLWSDKNIRNQILKEILENSKGPKATFSTEEPLFSNIPNITYSELFSEKNSAVKKSFEIISNCNTKNDEHPSVIIGFDGTKWFESGLQSEFLQLEQYANDYFSENRDIGICAYDLNKIPDQETLRSFVKCHAIVILDNPFVIYERGN
ncbi:MAG: hypothetical protein ACE5RK_05475 [Candidatus Nitrosomaritimum aestuariumsis]